ncbi:TIGR02450 family Trp-rich protein [Alkalimarinus sediminis]|uniref:TIGR02450 family Trp-rich protein n=1 Tax=Alkalimarinus sediminis TaxID=1632866 RepID=A0A9E8HNQ6_9ALTE|nr:TIGR02450 family Trp-rich protein [Alkalimarinus sediminis]UZW75963.1 TIGR02450 family Trp-rich protein [Alkalimarinus sediminis]
MNRLSPKALLHSKWTKTRVTNKEKHFVVVVVKFDEEQRVIECVIEAVINQNQYSIDWHELKNSDIWKIGWI